MHSSTYVKAAALVAATCALFGAASAAAGIVTTTGSFASYSGPVSYPPGTPEAITGFPRSFLNGELITPDVPASRRGVGLVTSHAFAPGTSSVDFYTDELGATNNRLQVTPAPAQDVEVGDEFLIGTFTLENGDWWGGFGEGDPLFSFSVTTSSADPRLNGFTFADTLHYNVTIGAAGNTSEQNADYFYFDGRPDLGTMRVYELFDHPPGVANIGSIDLYGRIGSLIPTRFANAQGGAFIAPRLMTAVPEPAMAG